MNFIQIEPLKAPLRGHVRLPFSKSISNRQLVLGAHTNLPFEIMGISEADDTYYLMEALRRCGYIWERREGALRFFPPHSFPASLELFLGEGGTTLRFLLPWLARYPGKVRIEVAASLQKRPILPLLESLQKAGVNICSTASLFPLEIEGDPDWQPKTLEIDSSLSSQFVSALLLLAPALEIGTQIREIGLLSATPSYRQITLDLLAQQGYLWERQGDSWILRAKGNPPFTFHGEADWSASSFFWGWAALGGFEGTLTLSPHALQPEKNLFPALPLPYAYSWESASVLRLQPLPHPIPPLDIDLMDYPDAFPVLSVVAAFAEGISQFKGLQTLPHKESNRLEAMRTELVKFGAALSVQKDAVIIYPTAHLDKPSLAFESYGDHRIAMALSLVAARISSPFVIHAHECVRKSFPQYWKILKRLQNS